MMIDKIKKLKCAAAGSGAVASHFHIEMDKCVLGMRLSVGGVRRISDYTRNFARLICRGLSVSVSGEGLSFAVYESKTVEISGNIFKVEFQYAAN